MNIALYPGSFSPPHIGHFDVVQKLCSEMDKVYIIKSDKERDGISAEQSVNVWNLYLQLLPDNVEIRLSKDKSPITECFHIIKNDYDNDYYIVFGKNELDRVRSFEKLNSKNVHIYNAGNYGNISATNFRQALRDRNIEQIKTFLPPGINVTEFMEKMGLNLHEIKILPRSQNIPSILDLGEEHEWEDTKYMGVFYGVLSPNKKYVIDYQYGENDEGRPYIILRPIENKKDLGRTDWYLDTEDDGKRYIDTKGLPIIYEKDGKLIREIKIVPNIITIDPQEGDIYEGKDKDGHRVTIIIQRFKRPGQVRDYEVIFTLSKWDEEYGHNKTKTINSSVEGLIQFIKTYKLKLVKKIEESLFTKNWWNKHLIQESQEQVTKLTDEQKTTIKQFIGYAFKELKITIPLNGLKLSYDNNAVKERASFAYYDPNTNKIWVYVKNRNMADILRSIAHELVHSRQNEEGRLKQNSGNTGSEIENEANSKAGVMLRNFGKDNKGIYEIKIVPNTNRLPSVFKGSDLKMYLYTGGSTDIDPYIGIDQVINAYKIPSNNKYIYLPGIPYMKKNGEPGVYVLAFEAQYFELHRDDPADQDIYTDNSWKLIIIGKDKFTDGKEIDEIKILPKQRKPQVGDIYEFLPESKWEGQYKIIEIEPEKRNQCTFLQILGENSIHIGRLYYDLSTVIYMIKEKMIKFIRHENIDEIKIQPNIRLKVGDKFVYENNTKYIAEITKIDYKTNKLSWILLMIGGGLPDSKMDEKEIDINEFIKLMDKTEFKKYE